MEIQSKSVRDPQSLAAGRSGLKQVSVSLTRSAIEVPQGGLDLQACEEVPPFTGYSYRWSSVKFFLGEWLEAMICQRDHIC